MHYYDHESWQDSAEHTADDLFNSKLEHTGGSFDLHENLDELHDEVNHEIDHQNNNNHTSLQPESHHAINTLHDINLDIDHTAHFGHNLEQHAVSHIPDQYFSPALSFQGTPLLSPHALAPQPVYRYRNGSGKISKHSPSLMRIRSASTSELDELSDFNLGDPAMSFLDDSPQPQPQPKRVSQHVDIDDKLHAAIAATTNANRRSSTSSSRHGSRNGTPRLRPKTTIPSTLNATSSSEHTSPLRDEDTDVPEQFTKSNYQNLMDGTHQHLGLSDGNRISNTLQSKRTVHKIAEKERRNRMSNAVAELSSLIGPVSDPNNINTSKAATVERATVYIKQLHARIAELERLKR